MFKYDSLWIYVIEKIDSKAPTLTPNNYHTKEKH